jgi:hypothetical protein
MIQHISADLLWSQIVARAWCDGALMKRLLSNPRDVLSEHGLEVPEDMDVRVEEGTEVKVVEDADAVHHFVLPVNPPDELIDEDLDGHAVAWCGWCGGCGCRCRCRC